MKSFQYTIKDELGIHARPAGMLAKEAKQCKSTITIGVNGKSADVTRLIAVMALGIKQGTEVTVSAEGEDEDTAIAKMQEFFENNM